MEKFQENKLIICLSTILFIYFRLISQNGNGLEKMDPMYLPTNTLSFLKCSCKSIHRSNLQIHLFTSCISNDLNT